MAKSGNGLKGCLIGCAGVLAGIIIVGAIGGYFVYRWGMNEYEKLVHNYETNGYVHVKGDIIDVKEKITDRTIYVGKRVEIHRGADRGIAIVAQTADLHGKFEGNVHFTGQKLTIHSDAILRLNLDVRAQNVNAYGAVEGEITGVYGTLDRTPPNRPLPQ